MKDYLFTLSTVSPLNVGHCEELDHTIRLLKRPMRWSNLLIEFANIIVRLLRRINFAEAIRIA